MVDAIQTWVTLDDLNRLGPDVMAEVIDGEIVEMAAVGVVHHLIVGNIYDPVRAYTKVHPIGTVFVDGLIYLLHRQGQRLRGARVPDVSFIRTEVIPADWDFKRPFPGAPTLAVEVMSPDDKVEDLQRRIRDYFGAGTEQIWVAFPETREVHQYRRGVETIRIYTGDEAIDAEALFPGLELKLTEIFLLPPWAM